MARLERLTPKQFEKSLAEYREGFVRNLEARCSGFDPDPVASERRRDKGRKDFEYFARTYFAHYIRGKKDKNDFPRLSKMTKVSAKWSPHHAAKQNQPIV